MLSHCVIVNSRIKEMTLALISFNDSLKKLDISLSNLSNDEAVAIGDYLSKKSTLCELNLKFNGIGMLGAKKIAQALMDNTTSNLKKLDISHNPICDDGAIAFGNCLKTNNTLVKLDLSFIDITIKPMTIFAEAIQINKGLHTLKLNQIGSIIYDDVSIFNMTILDAMYTNNTIMKLILPNEFPCDQWRYMYFKVEKINRERIKHGVDTFYTNAITCWHRNPFTYH